jgi:hypothetical protein
VGVAIEDDSAVSVLTVVKTWSESPCVYVHIQETPTLKRVTNWLKTVFGHQGE